MILHTVRMSCRGFEVDVIDEATNNPETHTHKDRLARAIVDFYREQLLGGLRLSIITAGSSGCAIQVLLRKHGFSNLNCLVDRRYTSETDLELMEDLGCNLFYTDLDRKALSPDEILSLTSNPDGEDITCQSFLAYLDFAKMVFGFGGALDTPTHVFVPLGSGALYTDCSNVSVLKGGPLVVGATTTNPGSKANKVYSSFNPFHTRIAHRRAPTVEFTEVALGEATDLFSSYNVDHELSAAAGMAAFITAVEDDRFREGLDLDPNASKVCVVSTGKLQVN